MEYKTRGEWARWNTRPAAEEEVSNMLDVLEHDGNDEAIEQINNQYEQTVLDTMESDVAESVRQMKKAGERALKDRPADDLTAGEVNRILRDYQQTGSAEAMINAVTTAFYCGYGQGRKVTDFSKLRGVLARYSKTCTFSRCGSVIYLG